MSPKWHLSPIFCICFLSSSLLQHRSCMATATEGCLCPGMSHLQAAVLWQKPCSGIHHPWRKTLRAIPALKRAVHSHSPSAMSAPQHRSPIDHGSSGTSPVIRSAPFEQCVSNHNLNDVSFHPSPPLLLHAFSVLFLFWATVNMFEQKYCVHPRLSAGLADRRLFRLVLSYLEPPITSTEQFLANPTPCIPLPLRLFQICPIQMLT